MGYEFNLEFPAQRVSGSQKNKAEWYANCIDYIIAKGLSMNNREETRMLLDIFHGNIPQEYYKKTLNPYNTNDERLTRFPATMWNLDIMTDIYRRYESEYHKGVHEFTVGADNASLVINKNEKLKSEVMSLCMKAFQEELQRLQQQAAQQGQENLSQQDMPDVEKFIEDFNNKYIDDESKQGQQVLDYIRNNTPDIRIYLECFSNYCLLGECYSYSEINGNSIYKECVPAIEAYPIPNRNQFVEDHDMFARRIMMTYQQILDRFSDDLTENDLKYLSEHYGKHFSEGGIHRLKYDQFFEHYPDVCEKFSNGERELFKREPVAIYDDTSDMFEVWHVVWRSDAKQGILKYITETGVIGERIVPEGYRLNKELGDLKIDWVYKPQVYEGYRIGTRQSGIYPIKARPIMFNRGGKLPYNGMLEFIPNAGKFSIIKKITPYQILRNIISFHREMVIAKNKELLLIVPQSLLQDNTEDKLYKMATAGIFAYDDSEDTNSLKAQQIRLLNADNSNQIKQLTELMEILLREARESVDMNDQRYGDINQSAGIGTTQEAIMRSSMGMVILVTMFDEFRKLDYNRDLDYAKLAFIEGLNTAYYNENTKQRVYISLDVNTFVSSDYSTVVHNESKELDKLQQLKQWAFSAAQNGDLMQAVSAITGNNVAQIKDSIEKFEEIKRQHEEQMKQMDQMIEQAKLDNALKTIEAQGEQDRLTQREKYMFESGLQADKLNADVAMNTPTNDNSLAIQAEQNKTNLANQKLQLDREKLNMDTLNKVADRQVKMKDIESKERIARINKNKYDK